MSCRWVVEKVVVDGSHGPYAVAWDKTLGSVTFSLGPDVWKERDNPERGLEVVLEDFQKKRGGWRAMSARLFRPEDLVNCKAGSKEQ